jgi:hypothetical protein
MDTVVLTSAINFSSMWLRLHYLEITNYDYNYLLNQSWLDYRIYKKGNSAQSFAINCTAGVPQQFQINSISGDCVGLLVYIRPALIDTSPALYDTFYQISSIQLQDQQNTSLTVNVNPISSDEMVDYAVMNSGHDFWIYRYVYLIPWTTSFTDCVINNKVNGAVRLPQPVVKITVTPTTTQANCTLTVLSYIISLGRISSGTLNDFSS